MKQYYQYLVKFNLELQIEQNAFQYFFQKQDLNYNPWKFYVSGIQMIQRTTESSP